MKGRCCYEKTNTNNYSFRSYHLSSCFCCYRVCISGGIKNGSLLQSPAILFLILPSCPPKTLQRSAVFSLYTLLNPKLQNITLLQTAHRCMLYGYSFLFPKTLSNMHILYQKRPL